mmetsp:Transcript_3259/g.4272  ORF Transcript_3259/g.4272 Transcript_3259/m.4272 type:complete len:353 (+) Transcript_3259:71-1129(+)|eukprot:CAMPEP_0117742614 /NCGR_PEP_ID=MMETSP0947-20121206/5647_1 /TAXON_ID=44440 /ORGANISM="Chattonella subsalsa, Strain CCMP2191" /LENGTH=352 /DNA_ID=CAMNT_0005559163 /DNA_START=88 /DNA_END=1146 /DNA_ORIENTATION=+
MRNFQYAGKNDQFSSIDLNNEEVVHNSYRNRISDAAMNAQAKCAQLFSNRKPFFILGFIVIIQMLWILGLTIQVSSLPHLAQKLEVYAKTVEDLQTSLQSAHSKIESTNSKFQDLEREFAAMKEKENSGTQILPTEVPPLQQQTEAPSYQPTQALLQQNEVRVGSETTETLRLSGNTIWFQDSKEIEIHEVPTSTSREWSQSYVNVTVGTKVTWTWTSNENLVEAAENYAVKADPSFSSGVIQYGGTLSHTFETPGTYFFVSENTASMRGKVVVTGSFIQDGTLSINNVNVRGSFIGARVPGTIHSFSVRSSSSYYNYPCPEGTSPAPITSPEYSGYAYLYSGYYLMICIYQ